MKIMPVAIRLPISELILLVKAADLGVHHLSALLGRSLLLASKVPILGDVVPSKERIAVLRNYFTIWYPYPCFNIFSRLDTAFPKLLGWDFGLSAEVQR